MLAAKKHSTHSAVQTNEPILHLFQLQILAGQIDELNSPFLVKMYFLKIFSRVTPCCETSKKSKEKTANHKKRRIIIRNSLSYMFRLNYKRAIIKHLHTKGENR